MPTDYVEDYEEVTGKKREDAFPAQVEAKVVTAPRWHMLPSATLTVSMAAKAEPKKTAARTKAPKVAPAPVAETA